MIYVALTRIIGDVILTLNIIRGCMSKDTISSISYEQAYDSNGWKQGTEVTVHHSDSDHQCHATFRLTLDQVRDNLSTLGETVFNQCGKNTGHSD